MSDVYDKLSNLIENLALEFISLDGEDIPVLGRMLEITNELSSFDDQSILPEFKEITIKMNTYLEKVILREIKEMIFFEEALTTLQHLIILMQNDNPMDDRASITIAHLNSVLNGKDEDVISDSGVSIKSKDSDEQTDEISLSDKEESLSVSDEDREILSGFVIESFENLETAEVSMIELEQDPYNSEYINDIFRAFHTIKGVSGFLGLTRINKLSHNAENLLDLIRGENFTLTQASIDVILDAIDILKKLIEGVKNGLEKNTNLDIGYDIEPLIERIESVSNSKSERMIKPIGEILLEKGDISKRDLKIGLEIQRNSPDKKIGEILIKEQHINPDKIDSALKEQKKIRSQKVSLQVKVDTRKLDTLVDLTGELVIAQTMLRQNQLIEKIKDQKLSHTLGQLNQITSSLQNIAMSLRMVPIRSTFQKMHRLIRDLSKVSMKPVQLTMSGEDTEIDRNVVDELYEPMVHMIRNSIDHGIESPDERKKTGKNKTGEIHLKAYHQGGNIIVEIQDDGKGLNTDKILKKAIENNIISKESHLSDDEIFQLIFKPGFSTATEVTTISGRGVGMDVVKKVIEKLRGRIEISSIEGKGSTFLLRLPLTLAIIEGMLIRVNNERYIIPALSILESFRPKQDQYHTVKNKGEMIMSRGNLIPLIRMDRIFNLPLSEITPWEGLVVVVETNGIQMGLLAHELLGKEEVVIKSLGESLKNVKGIAGGAIMGDGRIGLILDMAGVWDVTQNHT